jgi:cytochrome c peroxidase
MDKFVFKVPSLRNVAVTAPYLHDGSAKTLEDAISIMGKTQLGRTLTANEISLIKAFLNSLTGQYNNKTLGDAS